MSGTGASNSSTTTVEKNGQKTTVTVENGVKERHGNMAYYNKTTEKTSIDRKIADTDVTSELSTSKELGLYQSYNPTGFAPVTNQVREFDWNALKPVGIVVGVAAGAAVLYFGAPIIMSGIAAAAAIGIGNIVAGAATATAAYVVSKWSDFTKGDAQ